MNSKKYLICRPQGGLNDIFNQIERCRFYAWKHGRDLVVDTNYGNAIHFRDEFGYYFKSNRDYMRFCSAEDLVDPGEVSVLPTVLSGRLSGYPFEFDRSAVCYVESASRMPLTFDFSTDHDERVLVHHTGGGGVSSLQLLRRIQLRETVASEVIRRRGRLDANYIAVHARNTDLISNYRPIIAEINASGYRGQVLICTDDKNVVDEFRENLNSADVISLANLETGEDRRIHFLQPTDDARARNIDAICDLMLLALSNELFVAHLLPNAEAPGGFSGFSLLARLLHREPSTIWSLLGPSGKQIRLRSKQPKLRDRTRHMRAYGRRLVDLLQRG